MQYSSCSTVQSGDVLCIKLTAVKLGNGITLQCSQCRTVQCSAVQCSAVHVTTCSAVPALWAEAELWSVPATLAEDVALWALEDLAQMAGYCFFKLPLSLP